MLGVFQRDLFQTVFTKLQQRRARTSHQDRRVRRHDHLSDPGLMYPSQYLEKFDLARWREGGFRLVQNIKSLPVQSLVEETQKPFAVRMGQEIGTDCIGFKRGKIEIARHREEAFRPEKPSVGDFRQPGAPEGVGQTSTTG